MINLRQKTLGMIKDVVKTMPNGFSVWIYGSEARGESRQNSDIDLLVLNDSKRLSILEQQRLFAPFYKIELETGIQINPHYETQEQWNSRKTLFTINVNRDKTKI